MFYKKNSLALRSFFTTALISLTSLAAISQDNSPYSRYGIGDLVPNTNILNRGMGGISAAYADQFSINFNNPASYSKFKAFLEDNSKKVSSGRVLFDLGVNVDSRTLRQGNPPQKFTASNALFSYVQIGVPIRNNWGMSFGLRPISRVSYKIGQNEMIFDPNTNLPIDSAFTEFSGNGGSYLASIGTGFAIKNFSVGGTFGYLFGNKEFATKRAFINDTVAYNSSNHTTRASYGSIYFSGGAQYKIKLKGENSLTLGVYGNLKNTLSGTQDLTRETFVRSAENGDFRLDSVYEQKDVKGDVIYPSGIGAGFVYEKPSTMQTGGFLIGVDYIQNKWSEYHFFGNSDNVQDSWEMRIGTQLRPKPATNYWSNVAYRVGFNIGEDYVNVQQPLSTTGITIGFGLPLANYNRLSPSQFSIINVAMEYNKRGNEDNLLRENLFRLSVGLSLSDLWFVKRKYN